VLITGQGVQLKDALVALPPISFPLGPLEVTATDMSVAYDATGDQFIITGDLDVEVAGKGVAAELAGTGSAGEENGIYVNCNSVNPVNLVGSVSLLGSFDIPGTNWGVTDASFEFNTFENTYGIQATVGIGLCEIEGSFDFQGGHLNEFSLGLSGVDVPVGTTGLVLTGGSASIDNLAPNAGPIALSGMLDFAYGPTIDIELPPWLGGPHDYSLASGSLTITATSDQTGSDLILGTGSVNLADGLATATGAVELNLATGAISAGGSIDLLQGVFTASVGDTDLLDGKAPLNVTNGQATLNAAGTADIPSGGDSPFSGFSPYSNLCLPNAYLSLSYPDSDSCTCATAGLKIWSSNEPGLWVNGNGLGAILNATDLPQTDPPASATFSVASGTPWALLAASCTGTNGSVSVKIQSPDGTLYTQSDLPDNISIDIQTNGGTEVTANIQNPAAGDWTLTLPDASDLGTVSFQGLTGIPAPTSGLELVFLQSPGDTVSGTDFDPGGLVAIEDQAGDVVTTDSSQVTLTVTGGPGNTSTVLTSQAVNGIATFDAVAPQSAGSYTLTATDGTDMAASATFTVAPAAVSSTAFVQQPTSVVAGQDIAPAIVVQATDQNGNVINGDTVALALENYPSGTVYSTFTATTDSNGDATFGDVSLPTAGTYTVVATDGTVSSGNSGSFTVSPAAASTLVFAQQPGNAPAGSAISPNVVVDVEDQFGNLVTTDDSTVVLSLNGDAALNGTLAVQAQNGVATFSGLSVNGSGVYAISAADGSLAAATSSGFTVSRATPTLMLASPPTSITYDGTVDVTNWAMPSVSGVSGMANPTGLPNVVFYGGISPVGTPLASAPVDAGTYTAVASYCGDANYATAQSAPVTFTIAQASLTVSGMAASNKVYDGTTTATLNTAGAALQGVFSGDTVTLVTAGATGTFSGKNVANGLTVSVSGLTIGGPQAGDYWLTQPTATANIIARPITVTATPNVKIYDGTASASAVPTITSGSLVPGDTAAFSETFDNQKAGIGKTLTAAGSVNDGNGGNNYAVTLVTTTIGAIGPRAITVTAVSNSKVYDGTIAATATPAVTSGSLATGDTAAFSETYDTPAPGTGKTLTPSGAVSDVDGGADYSVTFVGNASGAITQTVDHFAVTASPAGITAGNNFILTVTAEDASGNAVTGYAGTVGFSSSDPLEPQPAGNLTFTPGTGLAAAMATLETAGSWAITVTDTSNPSIYGSTTVMVLAAPASKLVFGQQPANTSAGATITSTSSQAVTVEVEDPYGNLVSSSTANVTLAIVSGSGTLLGATTVQAAGGVASFSNLAIDQAGSYTLIASGTGLGGTATSSQFTITAGAPAQLAFTAQPANTPGANAMANVLVAVEDIYGNTVTTDNSSVTITLNAAASGGGGVLKGTATQSVSGGVATFGGLSIVDPSNPNWSAAGTGYTLTASDTDNDVTMPASKSAAFNTTLIVDSCTMTPTGFVATFSQPFKVATTPLTIGPNLYSAVATNNLPVNVSLIGSNEGTVRGSLVVNSTDTQITFVATTLVHSTGLPIAGVSSPDALSGILAPDGYTVVLDSTSTSFVTTNGQLLDGNDSGTGGSNFNQFTAVDNSADVDVVIPSFARGPSSSTVTSTVNVLNLSTPIFAASPISIASSAKNGATESGNTVTITTTSAHGLVTGQTVLIAGFSGQYSGYNGTFAVASVPTTTTFTFTDSTTGLDTSGGGTVTGYGLTESGNAVTAWTTVASELTVGEPVTISGAGVDGYNGTFTITSLPGGRGGTTFTYTDTTAGLANSGGGTAALARGIPISLSGPTSGVMSGQFTLTYSSSDLAISGALVDPNLAASYGATLSLDASSTPGSAIIDFSTTTPLPAASSAPILLGGLTATVPSTAYYKAKDLLHFSSVSLSAGGNSVAAIGTDALHLVVFPGNASGSGAITSADVLDMARVVAGADAGFAAYPLIDPDVIGDLLGDGAVDGPDGALLGRYVNGVTTPQMPVYPGTPVDKLSVAGPLVATSTPSAASAASAATAVGSVSTPTAVKSIGVARKVAGTLRVPSALTRSVRSTPSALTRSVRSTPSALTRSVRSTTGIDSAIASQQAVDGLFTALARGAEDVAELAIVGSGAEQTVRQALAAQMSAAGLAQTSIDSLFWESGDSNGLDGKRDWLF
jgi:hypothetical protein